ncbi:MAG: hypothetical protein AABZ60_14155 [Planctomycetota bacterium]
MMEVWLGSALLLLIFGTWKCDKEIQKTELALRQKIQEFQEREQLYKRELEKKQAEITLSQEIKIAQKKLEVVVDTSSISAEKIHQSMATVSFNFFKRLSPLKKPIELAQNIHDQTAKELYDSLREINQQVGSFTNEILKDNKKSSNSPS